MSDKIISSLTDDEIISIVNEHDFREGRSEIRTWKMQRRALVNAAAQRAVEEFMVAAKEREAKLISHAFFDGIHTGLVLPASEDIPEITEGDIRLIYLYAGLEELK